MARRKQRRTQRSRSQSTAARRRLTLGDIVRVKDGVMDPDYDGYCLGGWSGAIIAFETWEQTPMALIAWDASTQRIASTRRCTGVPRAKAYRPLRCGCI
jgi:hypothetical protein